jgi:hypothetical protein
MTDESEPEVKSFKEFLENTPPGKMVKVSDFFGFEPLPGSARYLETPILKLYCDDNECQGYRFFAYTAKRTYLSEGINNRYITYCCENCGETYKTFAIRAIPLKESVFKYGEVPPFGPPIPAKAINLIGPDKELFLTGRRAERQGMGIGAFAYYRRVVENQKDRIFDEVIRVINKISPDDPVLKELEEAKGETQFTKAVEKIKSTLPSSLNINGYNPLTLLHSALSEGVHEHSDDECLELAGDIRKILIEFADRLGQALKEDAELNAAITRLAKAKAIKKSKR